MFGVSEGPLDCVGREEGEPVARRSNDYSANMAMPRLRIHVTPGLVCAVAARAEAYKTSRFHLQDVLWNYELVNPEAMRRTVLLSLLT